MALNKFTDIDQKEITSKGVQALADRPNKASQYGQGGLSAIQLKKWFDNLAEVLREKINEDHATFASYDATKFVALSEVLKKKGIESLHDLIAGMSDGSFVEKYLMYNDSSELKPLANIIEKIRYDIDNSEEDISETIGDLEKNIELIYETLSNPHLTYEDGKVTYRIYDKYGNQGYISSSATLPIKEIEDHIEELETKTERRLDQLESATLQFTEDSTVAYKKVVPANSAKYALVNKVGGMTYKNNINNYLTLLRVDYNDTSAEVTINADNSITINKQDDDSGWVTIVYLPKDDIVEGRYFTSLNMPDYTSGISNISIASHYEAFDEYGGLQDGERTNELNSWIPKGDYYRNEISTISFYLGDNPITETFSLILTDTDDLWQGLRDTKVTELVSEGANLIPPCIRKNVTNNGITYTVLDDGTVIANGTATAQSNFAFQEMWRGEKITLTQGETYTLSGEPNGASADTYRLMMQNDSYSQNYYCGVPAVAKYTEYYAFIRIQQGITVNNLVFKPMLNRGSTAKPYSPFGTIVDTFPISAELRAFLADKGYGRGVSGYPNYIDFERKVFVQNTYRKVFDGTENWQALSISTVVSADKNKKMVFRGLTPQTIISNANEIGSYAICNEYSLQSANNVWMGESGFYADNLWLHIYDANYQTVEAWKAHLAELKASGNPLTVEYALETPIETDISAYLTDDNFIEVEGGGVIRAVNEYEFDAPTTIAYVSQKGS